MEDNLSIIDIEGKWDSKTEAHNNIINYLESQGMEEKELMQFVALLDVYSKKAIGLNNYIKYNKNF